MPSSENSPGLRFRGLKVATTWHCNASCAHCGVAAGPRLRARLDRSVVLHAIEEASALGLRELEITGGECFLAYAELLQYLDRAARGGMRSSVDTNGFWATTAAAAEARLAPLKERGVGRVVLSTDRYHQEYVPLSRVLNAVAAARRLEIAVGVTVCALAGDELLLDTVAALRRLEVPVQVQRISPFGRAACLPRQRMLRCSLDQAGAPCQATAMPTVAPDGRVTLCCAPPTRFPGEVAAFSPLVLGRLGDEPLSAILLRASRDPLLCLLAAGGAGAIVQHLRNGEPPRFVPRTEGYYGSCDLCVDVLASAPLVERLRRRFPAPSPAGADHSLRAAGGAA